MDDELTEPEQEVRRLLANARHTGPMPDDVVTRLDRVLADLATEPARTAAVVRLATRRRRVASLLVAAAAVVAIGIGVSQVIAPRGGGEDASAPAADDRGLATQEEAPEEGTPLAGSSDGEAAAPTEQGRRNGAFAHLRPKRFADDVIETRSGYAGADWDSLVQQLSADRAVAATCESSAWGQGSFVPVRYGNAPAVLVFRRALGDTQIADLFVCGSRDPVRSVTLPAP